MLSLKFGIVNEYQFQLGDEDTNDLIDLNDFEHYLEFKENYKKSKEQSVDLLLNLNREANDRNDALVDECLILNQTINNDILKLKSKNDFENLKILKNDLQKISTKFSSLDISGQQSTSRKRTLERQPKHSSKKRA